MSVFSKNVLSTVLKHQYSALLDLALHYYIHERCPNKVLTLLTGKLSAIETVM